MPGRYGSGTPGDKARQYAITAKVTDAETVLANYAITATDGVLTIEDRGAPLLVLPGPITVPATSTAGAIVEYTVAATDDFMGDLTPDCDPASGARFAIGTTTVTCAATDGPHTSSAPFEVEVTEPTPAQLADVVAAGAKESPAYLRLTTRQPLAADGTIGTLRPSSSASRPSPPPRARPRRSPPHASPSSASSRPAT